MFFFAGVVCLLLIPLIITLKKKKSTKLAYFLISRKIEKANKQAGKLETRKLFILYIVIMIEILSFYLIFFRLVSSFGFKCKKIFFFFFCVFFFLLLNYSKSSQLE